MALPARLRFFSAKLVGISIGSFVVVEGVRLKHGCGSEMVDRCQRVRRFDWSTGSSTSLVSGFVHWIGQRVRRFDWSAGVDFD